VTPEELREGLVDGFGENIVDFAFWWVESFSNFEMMDRRARALGLYSRAVNEEIKDDEELMRLWAQYQLEKDS
jgi:hypothetical protein